MKQVFLQQGKARLFEVDLPTYGEHDVLVRVHYSFISSGTEYATVQASGKNIAQRFTDNVTKNSAKVAQALREHGLAGTVSLIKGAQSNVLPVGYSCSGVVVACGASVTQFLVGDFVACGGAGFANHAELVAVPEYLTVKLRDQQNLKTASITTLAAIALQGLRRAQLQLGDHVCVIGLGLLGQMTVQLAKVSGAFVHAVDLHDDRLVLAKQYGADYIFNGSHEDWRQSIAFATGQHGVDVTIITAASNTGKLLNDAMVVTRRKGKVVLVGDVKLDFDRDHFYAKEIDLLISCSYGPGRYDQRYERESHDYPYAYVRWTENRNMALCAKLIEDNRLQIMPLIQQEFMFDQADQAYVYLSEQRGLGIVLRYNVQQSHVPAPQISVTKTPRAIPSLPINVAVVGLGGFSKIKLLPTIASLKQVILHTVVDVVGSQAISVANQYGVERVHTSYESILHDPAIHVVVIATPHALHAPQVVAALEQGKAVFAEKPLAVTHEQLSSVATCLQQRPDAFLAVDFNRSWSPMMCHIKKMVQQRATPLMVTYRMNIGYLSSDHWIQSAFHGGRMIGEACHIFELFLFLTDGEPQFVTVHFLPAASNGMKHADNTIVTITMRDGSVCSLVFTSIGSSRMRKEYMELFVDGKSLVMDDYTSLRGYGTAVKDHLSLSTQDKGHEALIRTFFDRVPQRDAQPPVSYERLLKATELSIVVDSMIQQGRSEYRFA